jgi:hypothetical protein
MQPRSEDVVQKQQWSAAAMPLRVVNLLLFVLIYGVAAMHMMGHDGGHAHLGGTAGQQAVWHPQPLIPCALHGSAEVTTSAHGAAEADHGDDSTACLPPRAQGHDIRAADMLSSPVTDCWDPSTVRLPRVTSTTVIAAVLYQTEVPSASTSATTSSATSAQPVRCFTSGFPPTRLGLAVAELSISRS